ncbi:hypothetical protein NVP1031O_185 [Vibrio phage 1.031.O._10N.261.46.F8]|nr:hypothetical protein NVP1031O_185 [Vibrio phage 1.031.O._10N.261.46.F8]
MLVSEIRDKVLVESGNLFLADLSLLGVNPSQFLTILRTSLKFWSQYRSHTGTSTLLTENGIIHFGALHSNWLTYLAEKEAGLDPLPVTRMDVIPDLISDVSRAKYDNIFDRNTQVYQYEKPVLKVMGSTDEYCTVEWKSDFVLQEVGKYDPVIQPPASPGSTTMPGTWDPNVIPSLSQPRQVAPSAPEDELALWEVVGLESTDRESEFIEYLTGKFMVTLGRSRRGFQLNESPVQIDADSLISEGQTMVDNITEQMQETSDVFDTLLETPVSGWF